MRRLPSKEYLESNGWRKIGTDGRAVYWDHTHHQPRSRGAFTTQSALEHQHTLDQPYSWCDCIKPEEEL